MEKLTFDTGLQSYRVGGAGVLKFNPCDPNVYARFLEAAEKIKAAEQELAGAEDALRAMTALDKRIKGILNEVFGSGNDFNEILGGVNLLAVAGNGERVITNLLTALQPVLIAGARRCAEGIAAKAV